jgi:hypothetical protein
MADFGRLANELSIQQQKEHSKRNSFMIVNTGANNLQTNQQNDEANIFSNSNKSYKSHCIVSLPGFSFAFKKKKLFIHYAKIGTCVEILSVGKRYSLPKFIIWIIIRIL